MKRKAQRQEHEKGIAQWGEEWYTETKEPYRSK